MTRKKRTVGLGARCAFFFVTRTTLYPGFQGAFRLLCEARQNLVCRETEKNGAALRDFSRWRTTSDRQHLCPFRRSVLRDVESHECLSAPTLSSTRYPHACYRTGGYPLDNAASRQTSRDHWSRTLLHPLAARASCQRRPLPQLVSSTVPACLLKRQRPSLAPI